MTPVNLAQKLTRGKFAYPRHLRVLNRALWDVAMRKVKRLLVTMPPRHGKSETCSHYFPAWYLGNWPDDRFILTSYEANFAASWGRKARDSLTEARSLGVYSVRVRSDVGAASEWQIDGHDGGMITAGVGGAITGRGGNIILLDDCVKNAEEAASQVYRDKAWDWYNSTLFTRLEPDGAIIIVVTRWHQDDIPGRLLRGEGEDDEPWTVIDFPALAEENDPLGRQPGEALWPERFSAQRLESIRRQIGSYWWSALYQQQPTSRSGGLFRREWFKIVDAAPAVATRVRYWDLAATQDGGDWTVGLRMAKTADGLFYVEDVKRAQVSPAGVEALVVQTAQLDGKDVAQRMEEEPGSAGKGQTARYTKLLAGFSFKGVRSTGDKAVRADPFAAQAEAGNVLVVRGPWNEAYLQELEDFGPGCAHDDQVDTSSGGLDALVNRPGIYASVDEMFL